jgi:hypothetical protein
MSSDPQEALSQEAVAAAEDPHAGMNIDPQIPPQAHQQLQEMLAQGQDPHAGLNLSGTTAKDPHEGLTMPASMGSTNLSASPYSWAVPEQWEEIPGQGMRIVTFNRKGDPQAIDCSIVSLGPMAGGLEANLTRWMGQVGIDPSQDNIQKLFKAAMKIKTKGGFEAAVYDLTLLQKDKNQKSMLAGIVSSDEATVFVKMTGTIDSIKQEQGSYLSLIKSLSSK